MGNFVREKVAEEKCVLWPIIDTLRGTDTRLSSVQCRASLELFVDHA